MERLTVELEVSRSSIKRDIEYMRDFMGAPVEYVRAANGYRYDPSANTFELPGLWFNATELYALLAMHHLLDAAQPELLTPYIGPLKGRIRTLLEQSGFEADTVTSRILLQPVARRSVNMQCFGALAEAVLQGRQIEIEYHGRERASRTRRRIHPYRLLNYRDNWYVVAFCERADDYRTFSLDRVEAYESSERSVKPADATDLDRLVGASFGIFTGTAKAWAVLRFSAQRARWVSDEVWHSEQIGQWIDGVYELQVPYSDPRELLMDILKFGPDVEVVAPDSLRMEVATRLSEGATLYKTESIG